MIPYQRWDAVPLDNGHVCQYYLFTIVHHARELGNLPESIRLVVFSPKRLCEITDMVVCLVRSWDSFTARVPLSMSRGCSESDSWNGTYYQAQSVVLEGGMRYWYYYIIDGSHVLLNEPSAIETSSGLRMSFSDALSPKEFSNSHLFRTWIAENTAANTPESRGSSLDVVKVQISQHCEMKAPKPISALAGRKIVKLLELAESFCLPSQESFGLSLTRSASSEHHNSRRRGMIFPEGWASFLKT